MSIVSPWGFTAARKDHCTGAQVFMLAWQRGVFYWPELGEACLTGWLIVVSSLVGGLEHGFDEFPCVGNNDPS